MTAAALVVAMCLLVVGIGSSALAASPAAPLPSPLSPLAQGEKQAAAAGTPVTPNPRTAWFTDAKFGMFIHWGLYAIPAGTWKGRRVPGIGEWIMHRALIPVKEYEQLAARFNPTKFDAEAWAQLAQDAGMKYLVITAKHHDGFAMYHSKASRYNVVDAAPWRRDPMMDLASACAKRGIRFCFYYSQAQDWHEPGGMGNAWDFDDDDVKAADGSYDRYLQSKVLPQVQELLTQYGRIGLIWFDTPRGMTPQRAAPLTALVRRLQPECLINGRLGAAGDYVSMGDNRIPDATVEGPWETPATFNNTWGYKSYDAHWKSAADIIFKLVDICAKGGNYLLNVGPTAEGVIPDPCPERLRAVGRWLKANGEAVYGTHPHPLGDEFAAGAFRCTAKGPRLYLHLFEWPAGGAVSAPMPKEEISRAYLLADPGRGPLPFSASNGRLTVQGPAAAPDPVDTVIVLELK